MIALRLEIKTSIVKQKSRARERFMLKKEEKKAWDKLGDLP